MKLFSNYYVPLFDDWSLVIDYSKQIVRYCLIIGVWLLIISQPASAQEVSLSVSPPVIEVLLAPGKKITQTFTVQAQDKNYSPTAPGLALTPELHLVKPSDELGHVTLDPNPLNPSSLPVLITSSPPLNTPFIVPPPSSPSGRSQSSYSLTLEASATDTTQDLYLALVFKTSPTASPLTRQNLAVGGGISALILITLDPTDAIPIDLSLTNFSPPTLHDSWTPLTISPTLKNTTAIMIRPQGLYEIISPTGKTLFSLPLYPTLVLGNSSRAVQGVAKGPTLAEQGSDLNPSPGVLTFTPAWHNLGPHRLRLTITSEGGNELTSSEKLIWILPLRLTLICLVVLVLLISFFLTRYRLPSPTLPE